LFILALRILDIFISSSDDIRSLSLSQLNKYFCSDHLMLILFFKTTDQLGIRILLCNLCLWSITLYSHFYPNTSRKKEIYQNVLQFYSFSRTCCSIRHFKIIYCHHKGCMNSNLNLFSKEHVSTFRGTSYKKCWTYYFNDSCNNLKCIWQFYRKQGLSSFLFNLIIILYNLHTYTHYTLSH
jgi:hypothetical protein